MTKEELIKIFSAYLPYKVPITLASEEYNYDGLTTVLSPHYLLDWQRNKCKISLHLYDLSYLTKEIEHEGEKFIPLHKILEEYSFDLSKMDEEYILSFKESLIEVDMSYKTAQMLLSWHFNVFNIPADQFINKATLDQ